MDADLIGSICGQYPCSKCANSCYCITDKGEMRISQINRIQLAIIRAIRVKHCAPLFPIRVNPRIAAWPPRGFTPCPSVVKNLLRKERCHGIALQRGGGNIERQGTRRRTRRNSFALLVHPPQYGYGGRAPFGGHPDCVFQI